MDVCTTAASPRRARPPAFDIRKSRLVPVVLAVLAACAAAPHAQRAGAKAATGELVHVIVTGVPGTGAEAARAVRTAGGRVLHDLSIINGFDAVVPSGAITSLGAIDGVRSVTPDAGVTLNGSSVPDPAQWPGASPYDPKAYPGSLYNVAREINADDFWNNGYTGKGVGVALIDSGVAPVADIATNLVNGPDLSLDANGGPNDGIDAFGHGTHMAGIIAGREPGLPSSGKSLRDASASRFMGIAPDAKVINVKVATADGSVDVSQVIAGIDWVVEHRNDPGMNIRVLNLSFGTDGVQDYTLDPLTYAVEVAWRAGIVVVVAAGNNGIDHPQLNNPAYDPFVIAAGAQDQNGTVDTSNDVVADFSSRGNSQRRPDILTPGRSIVSLRDPGSVIDNTFSNARVGDDQFKGSGTSQSAAVLSGAIALALQRYPNLTPDQVKAGLMATGRTLKTSSGQTLDQGMKTIDLGQAPQQLVTGVLARLLPAKQNFTPATGLGSLEASRGSYHLVDTDTGSVLEGEMDVTGAAWDPQAWSAAALSGHTWRDDTWMGRRWTGTSWSGRTWSGQTWTSDPYSGHTWRSTGWSDDDFSGHTWRGTTFSGHTWRADEFSGHTWRVDEFSGHTWRANAWTADAWASADRDPTAASSAS
jgi:serine protease AprX